MHSEGNLEQINTHSSSHDVYVNVRTQGLAGDRVPVYCAGNALFTSRLMLV